MRSTDVPPYWEEATFAMIWAIWAVAVLIDFGDSTRALPIWKPFVNMPGMSMRQQLVIGWKGL